jgi:hypothetical protein
MSEIRQSLSFFYSIFVSLDNGLDWPGQLAPGANSLRNGDGIRSSRKSWRGGSHHPALTPAIRKA